MERCPGSYDPYVYCPLMFKKQDDTILNFVQTIVSETHRISESTPGDEARMIDRYAGELSAYLNGRIRQIIEDFEIKARPKGEREVP
ncbi:MAG: hypothetical protein PHY29_03020 [Syntrophales bacterium]|nr:hypothetical protein [Syntrophales bacterium]